MSNVRWDDEMTSEFLRVIAETGRIAEASRAVGVTRQAGAGKYHRLRTAETKSAEVEKAIRAVAARVQKAKQASMSGRPKTKQQRENHKKNIAEAEKRTARLAKEAVPVSRPQGVVLQDLGVRTCRFIVHYDTDGNARFCNEPASPHHRSWCQRHYERVFENPKPAREEALMKLHRDMAEEVLQKLKSDLARLQQSAALPGNPEEVKRQAEKHCEHVRSLMGSFKYASSAAREGATDSSSAYRPLAADFARCHGENCMTRFRCARFLSLPFQGPRTPTETPDDPALCQIFLPTTIRGEDQ